MARAGSSAAPPPTTVASTPAAPKHDRPSVANVVESSCVRKPAAGHVPSDGFRAEVTCARLSHSAAAFTAGFDSRSPARQSANSVMPVLNASAAVDCCAPHAAPVGCEVAERSRCRRRSTSLEVGSRPAARSASSTYAMRKLSSEVRLPPGPKPRPSRYATPRSIAARYCAARAASARCAACARPTITRAVVSTSDEVAGYAPCSSGHAPVACWRVSSQSAPRSSASEKRVEMRAS